MAIAYFMAHMPRDFFPVNNGGDAAISFCFIFLYLVFAGPGALALDNRRSLSRHQRRLYPRIRSRFASNSGVGCTRAGKRLPNSSIWKPPASSAISFGI